MSNYYDNVYDSSAYSVEQAILAEDVRFTSVKNINGKFFIKILTPMVNSNKAAVQSRAGLKSSNYITLSIPSYLLFQFMNIGFTTIDEKKVLKYSMPDGGFVIPKGTIFFIEFLGGQAEADKAYIIGISPFKYVV